MRFARFLARRLLWSIAIFWAVGSVTYVIVVNMPSMSLSAPEYLDIEYIAWIIDYMTFDWGQGVTAAFAQTIPVTLAYLVPALVISVGGGVAFGMYAATEQGGVLDRLAAILGSLGIGFPVFWLAAVTGVVVFKLFEWLAIFHPDLEFWHPVNLGRLVIPIGIVSFNLFAVQVYYTRSAAANQMDESFVKVVRAKGGSRFRVARHVLRTVWLPLFSLFFTELFGMVFLSAAVIEWVLDINGVAVLMLRSFAYRSPDFIMASISLIALIGLVGRLVQDSVAFLYDPRVERSGQ